MMQINQPVELVMSRAAHQVMKEENDIILGDDIKQGLFDYLKLPSDSPLKLHSLNDYGASIASGSYKTKGMVILPCSLGTLGAVAHGLTENLIHRAAVVCLKERRPFMLVIREMPFGHIQLKNLLAVSEAGGIVACASPGFYHRPQTISDQVDFVVGRVLDQFNFDNNLFKRWKQDAAPLPVPASGTAH
jgi:4-hydroxy-3-polyprenylbenzoate decarboxylase